MLKNLLLSTLLSLKAHKLRVFLTMVGIIIGITAVVTVSAIGEGMKQKSLKMMESADANSIRLIYKVDQEDDSAVASQSFDQFAFNMSDLKMLRKLDGVDNISADYSMGFGGFEGIDVQMAYFDTKAGGMVQSYSKPDKNVMYGSDFKDTDFDKNKIVLSYDTMQSQLNIKKPKDIIGKAIDVEGEKFQVVGVKKKIGENEMITDSSIFTNTVPKKAYNSLAKNKPINAIKLKAKEGTDRMTVVEEANKLLKDYHPELVGNFEEDRSNEKFRQEMEQMLQGVVMGLLFITAISLLVGGIGVMNIMYVSVSERKREIGIRRAIGAKPSNILIQFLLEAAFITLIGGILGVLLGSGIANLISNVVPDIEAIVSPKMAFMSAGISAGIGLIFGVIPAINAAKMDPIKAIYQ
ncbi:MULTISPECIES: FtsX-like permease family protein [Vagococcus]|uniref:ABC transporter, permease protein n=1 Tax=Vagococcus fluvialis bH819 TaxID=1255619 RepID=A0A1X6WJX0_9ENTE|nr:MULTISPECIES: FtsX-like permease family protein [Vagococcus]SLM84565.1 ABC transporter, permease protein [Vagococcus fluvialis bH819]HCM89970.1 ABC transporter permease [Vagococcus sp.]